MKNDKRLNAAGVAGKPSNDGDTTYKMDEFAFVDYKKPLGNQQDMRTSTYLATKYISDTMLDNKVHGKYVETLPYKEDELLAEHRISDYKANYIWKYGDPNFIRNPTLGQKIENIKTFYESKLKFMDCLEMIPAASVTQTDYIWDPEPPMQMPVPAAMSSAVANTKININRNQQGYTKYLDTLATTHRLDYCHRTPKDIMSGIAAKDNITFWNWKEHRNKKVVREADPLLCDKYASNECVKRRAEFQTQLKHVPYTGLTTETRDNYQQPIKHSVEYDSTQIRNDLTFEIVEPSPKKTEYSILGSGERTQKYV